MPYAALRDANLLTVAISFSSTGDNAVVAAVANKQIRIYRLFFVVSAATNLIFKDGASVSLSGAIPFTANGGLVLDQSNDPWVTTTTGNAFIINQSGTANVAGIAYYQQP